MFYNNGNYEKDIVRFSGTPFDVSCTGENIVAVTICDKHEVVFVSVITDMYVEYTPSIGTRSINLPLGSKYTM
jgi:hypothetical protein